MYSSSADQAADYKSNHLNADVDQASPHRLIQMLMQKLSTNLVQADNAMGNEMTARKGELISNSISIIDCLRTSLSFEQTNGVAENLDRLYDFMTGELLQANLHNDRKRLGHVKALITEIKSAWDQIDPQ